MLHGLELLQVRRFDLAQAEEILCRRIIQAAAFEAHTLPDAFCFEHLLALPALALPALVRVKSQSGFIRYRRGGFYEQSCCHAQNQLAGRTGRTPLHRRFWSDLSARKSLFSRLGASLPVSPLLERYFSNLTHQTSSSSFTRRCASHRLNNLLFKFRRVSFVGIPFGVIKHPICYSVYHTV